MIIPPRAAPYYPLLCNITEHGIILPAAIMNSILQPRINSVKKYFSALMFFSFGYFSWLVHINIVTGKWVYPFLNAVGTTKVLTIVYPVTAVISFSAALLGIYINDKIWAVKRLKTN